MDFGIEGLHEETGPGRRSKQRLRYDKALPRPPTRPRCSRPSSEVIAQRNSMMATFMAKWSRDWPGQSGHIHLSLKDRDGKPMFYDASTSRTSDERDHAAFHRPANKRLRPELLAMVAPTINSYTRLIPGFWAPTEATRWRREPHPRLAHHSRQREITTRGISSRGRRCESYISILAAVLGSGL